LSDEFEPGMPIFLPDRGRLGKFEILMGAIRIFYRRGIAQERQRKRFHHQGNEGTRRKTTSRSGAWSSRASWLRYAFSLRSASAGACLQERRDGGASFLRERIWRRRVESGVRREDRTRWRRVVSKGECLRPAVGRGRGSIRRQWGAGRAFRSVPVCEGAWRNDAVFNRELQEKTSGFRGQSAHTLRAQSRNRFEHTKGAMCGAPGAYCRILAQDDTRLGTMRA